MASKGEHPEDGTKKRKTQKNVSKFSRRNNQ